VTCLVDTNVLVRLAVPADPHHLSASRAVEAMTAEGLYVAGQNLIEFWNVSTRPVQNNGLGQTTTTIPEALTHPSARWSLAKRCVETLQSFAKSFRVHKRPERLTGCGT